MLEMEEKQEYQQVSVAQASSVEDEKPIELSLSHDEEEVTRLRSPQLYSDTPNSLPVFTLESEQNSTRRTCVGVCFMIILLSLTILSVFLLNFLSKSSNDRVGTSSQRTFMLSVSPQGIQNTLNHYTEEPRLAGTKADFEMANYIKDRAIEFGLSQDTVKIVGYKVLLNQPTRLELKMLAPKTQTLSSWRATTDLTASFPPFHMYSKNASISGKVVYANYGRRKDFETLVAQSITISGAVVLLRVGEIKTAAKIRNAESFGAAGVLVYGDQQTDLSTYIGDGDPSTPFGASTDHAFVLSSDQVRQNSMNMTESVSNIPSLPISSEIAQYIFGNMSSGTEIPSELKNDWNGPLKATQRLDGDDMELLLNNEVTYERKLIRNVIVTIPGDEEPDRCIIVGSQRDSLESNIASPGSGVAVFVELLRGIGTLVRGGWAPRRTLILASWGAEQYSSSGSTEWMQEHLWYLKIQAVAYFDIGTAVVNGSGYLFATGSPSLVESLYSSTQIVQEPSTATVQEEEEEEEEKDVEILPQLNGMIATVEDINTIYNVWAKHSNSSKPVVDSPSYPPFLSHLGIPTLSLKMHTDSTGFLYHRAMTQIWGNLILNFCESPLLPFDFREYTKVLSKAIDSLDTNDTDGLRNAIIQFNQSAYETYEMTKGLEETNRKRIRQVNDRLYYIERTFVETDVYFSYSSWWKHQIYVASWLQNYQIQSFGQIHDLIEQKHQDLAIHLDHLAESIQQAAVLLSM